MNSQYSAKIREFLENHQQEMLEDLMALMRIDSSLTPAEAGAPFGPGTAAVFDIMQELFNRYGFKNQNYDYYALAADFSEAEKKLDVLCHLDVVPSQEGWKITTAFEPKIVGSRLYGRGATDDKGPAIAALYAMRAIRELGLPMAYSLRMVLGGDEETGSQDMDYYYSREKYAPATISPDSSFPVVNVEKGIMAAPFTMELPKLADVAGEKSGLCVTMLRAGIAGNMVPSYAEARIYTAEGACLHALQTAAGRMENRTGVKAVVTGLGAGFYKLETTGSSTHASTPEAGRNALTAMLAILSELPLAPTRANGALKKLAEFFPYGAHYGEGLGVAMADEVSGPLTLSFNILRLENDRLSGRFDSRVPICATMTNAYEPVASALRAAGFTVNGGGMKPPHYIPENSELVQKLLDSYEAVTGVRKRPLAIGGCTYIHGFPNAVAFGIMEEEIDNCIHAQDEFVDIPHLVESACILAEAFLRLCN